jgi:hypothetical protein
MPSPCRRPCCRRRRADRGMMIQVDSMVGMEREIHTELSIGLVVCGRINGEREFDDDSTENYMEACSRLH